MRRWKDLMLVETIYEADKEEEEEDDDDDEADRSNPLSSFTVSPETFPSVNLSSASSTPDLQIIVDEWSKTVECKSNILIRVNELCFFLHREPMSFHSRYLRRLLSTADDVSLSPPLSITVETFIDVARFCYGGFVKLTALNLAALTAAAEWLEMEEEGGERSLVGLTEDFFRLEIAGDEEKTAVVLRCSVKMLLDGDGEVTASMAARCLQLLSAAAEEDGGFGSDWTGELMELPADSFGLLLESMARWSLHDHDTLYKIVDQYFGVNKERLGEEEKLRICKPIDSTKLSRHLLLHLVQNSRLPVRFILKAMLLLPDPAAVPATSHASSLAVRIESLERDLRGLRRRLSLDSAGRSKSFRFLHEGGEAADPMPEAEKMRRRRMGLGRRFLEGFRRLFRRRDGTVS